MRASTARGIETIFWLGVWGIGIWWFANNILPLITQALKQGVKTTPTPAPAPAPAPTSPSTPLPAPDLGTSFGDVSNMVQSLWNVFSGLGKQGLLQNEDVKKVVSGALSAEDVANLTPTVSIGRGSGYGRSYLSKEELERRLALARQREHIFSPGG